MIGPRMFLNYNSDKEHGGMCVIVFVKLAATFVNFLMMG